MINFVWPTINYHELYVTLGEYALLVIKAVIILIIGLKLIKWIVNLLNKRLEKGKIDSSLKTFLTQLLKIFLTVILFITIIGIFGIEVTSFVAIIGSIGFALGLAFQGSLANFAGGILILLLKPYKVGDFIEANGFSGTVKDIQIFYTILSTTDNRRVIIPNANLSNSSMINYSTFPTRRLEIKIGCNYNNDINLVKEILEQLVINYPQVLKDPKPEVFLAGYGQSSIDFIVQAWVKTQEFRTVYYDLMFKIKGEFDKFNINIPYQQIDIHMIKDKNDSV